MSVPGRVLVYCLLLPALLLLQALIRYDMLLPLCLCGWWDCTGGGRCSLTAGRLLDRTP